MLTAPIPTSYEIPNLLPSFEPGSSKQVPSFFYSANDLSFIVQKNLQLK